MGGGPATEHLLITLPIPEPRELIKDLQRAHPSLTIVYHLAEFSKPIPVELFKPATILLTLFDLPPDPKHDSPNLRWVHFFSAGTNKAVEHPIYTDTDVILTTSSGVHGPQIAEWVVMTGLVQSRKYNMLYEMQKKHEWSHMVQLQRELGLGQVRDQVGQKIGILGYGSIGRQVGRVARAMGMDVVAYTAGERKTKESKKDIGYIVPGTGDPDGEIPSKWFSGTGPGDLDKFLSADLDWVVVSVPLTPATRHLLSKHEFEILSKRNAFLTNISRGDILNQEDLIAALSPQSSEGRADNGLSGTDPLLRGAALDVASPEPLPSDSPLWGLENVTITPHISGLGIAYGARAFDILSINLTRKEKGDKLLNVVDRKRGY